MTPENPHKKSVTAIRRTVLLAVLFFVPILPSLRMPPLDDPDLWWHLRTGQWIMQHHAVPTTDPFSAYGAGQPWAAYSWLFEVLAYGSFERWGLLGVLVFQNLVAIGIIAAVMHLVRRFLTDFTKAAVLTAAVVVGLQRLYTPRPWLFTILLFVLELDIVLATRTDGRVRRLVWIPILTALWANIHVQFVYGLFLLGIATAEQWICLWKPVVASSRCQRLAFTFCLFASALAVGLNPYGLRLYNVTFELAIQTGALSYVSELAAIPFRYPSDFVVLLIGFGAVAALAWKRDKSPFWIILLSWSATTSFRSVRDSWVLVVVGTALLAIKLRSERDTPYHIAKLQWTAVAVIVLVASVVAAQRTGISNAKLESKVAEHMPVGAVAFIKANHLSGALYNHYDWGGYLIWSLPEIPVGMDSRQNVHGDFRIMRARNTWAANHEWTSEPELAAARLVVLPLDMPLTQVLRLDQRYRLAYQDKVAVVFVRPEGTQVAFSATQAAPATVH